MNAESEQQTIKDGTKGPERPSEQRGAVNADSVPEEPGEAGQESQHVEGMIMSHVEGPTGSVPAGDPGNQSVAELIKQVSEESSRLLRGELKLAQAEMTQTAKTAGVGMGAFGAAAVLGWFALGCFLAAAILALALVLPAWLAALIVAVVVAIAAGIAALVGKKKVAEAGPPVPTDTVESVKKDVEEIKESVRR